jgi:hypothetical protein
MNETTWEIGYEAEGVHMLGCFAAAGGADPAGRRPGILVSPPGPGLGEHTKGVVRRLARHARPVQRDGPRALGPAQETQAQRREPATILRRAHQNRRRLERGIIRLA